MTRHSLLHAPPPASVSLHFVLAAHPSRAAAFRAGMTAVLHAGFSFGRELPGHLLYSHDAAGDHYGAANLVPAGSTTTLRQAQEHLGTIAAFYNQSVGLAFADAQGAVAVNSRVYDEPRALVFSLDWAAPSWQQLARARGSAQIASNVLIDAGRIIFTLLPLNYLLIGPTALLNELPLAPSHARLRAVPVAMVAHHDTPSMSRYGTPRHIEQLPRGTLIVQNWDVSSATPATPPRMRAKTRRSSRA